MPLTPAESEAEFAAALLDHDHAPPSGIRAGYGRRFDVHRNNVAVSLIEVLHSVYPATYRLVGKDYFRAAARAYLQAHPPGSPVISCYGDRFGEFLQTLPSFPKYPYLADVARLEWARMRSLQARDEEVLPIERLVGVSGALIENITLKLHPSVSLITSRWPVVSLWSAMSTSKPGGNVDMKAPESALVVRPYLEVHVYTLLPGGHLFMSALGDGVSLGAAARQALNSVAAFDLAGQLQQMFGAGAVAGVDLPGRGAAR